MNERRWLIASLHSLFPERNNWFYNIFIHSKKEQQDWKTVEMKSDDKPRP